MKLHFTAHHASENQVYLHMLHDLYGHHPIEECDIIVAIGGDGFMLETIHRAYQIDKPVFGMKGGSLGFLMNSFSLDNLPHRIKTAASQILHPLRMVAECKNGEQILALAFNEVVLHRASRQTAKLKVYVDNVLRLEELVCDGIMLATPAGSTAYNFSVSGPVLPIGANVLALTPVASFRPRRWRGAILPHTSVVKFEALYHQKRPVDITADHIEVSDVLSVTIAEAQDVTAKLLFDCHHPLPERILSEQFSD